MMTFALLAPYQILEVCLWQGKSESDIHGTYFFQKFVKKLSEWTLEILAPTVTYFKKNTFGAKSIPFLPFFAIVRWQLPHVSAFPPLVPSLFSMVNQT